MKKKLSLLLVFILFLTMPVVINATMVTPEISWSNKYGGGMGTEIGNSKANYVQQTSDGGYIVAGHTEANSGDVTGNHGGFDAWIIKLNSDGEISWSKCLGGSGDDYANYILQTNDGGYIVVCQTDSSDGDVSEYLPGGAWVVKLTSEGAISWDKCFDIYSNAVIWQRSDGGYTLMGGNTILDLDNNGEILTSMTLEGGGGHILQSNDGGYFAADGNNVMKYDNNGTLLWTREGIPCEDIDATSDGGLIATGSIIVPDWPGSIWYSSDICITKIDSIGRITFQKIFGDPFSTGAGKFGQEYAHSVQQTSDGGYIVAGEKGVGSFYTHIWIIKLSSIGELSWEKELDDYMTYASAIRETSDGGYIVAGTNQYGAGNADAYAAKLTAVISVQGVNLDREIITLPIGGSTTLTATITPADAANKTVRWTSDNADVATVDANGTVTGILGGTALITVTTEDGGFTTSCAVTVLDPIDMILFVFDGSVTDGTITWVKNQRDLDKFRDLLIEAKIFIDGNNQAAAIDKLNTAYMYIDGLPKPKDLVIGTATTQIADMILDLIESLKIPVTGVTLDQNDVQMAVKTKITLIATIEPFNALDKGLVWSSNNRHIAKVNSDGVVMAMRPGSTVILVTTSDGAFRASCTITVIKRFWHKY